MQVAFVRYRERRMQQKRYNIHKYPLMCISLFCFSIQPYHNFSKGDPVDDLSNCSRKLELLAEKQAIREEVPKLSNASDQFKVKTGNQKTIIVHVNDLVIQCILMYIYFLSFIEQRVGGCRCLSLLFFFISIINWVFCLF